MEFKSDADYVAEQMEKTVDPEMAGNVDDYLKSLKEEAFNNDDGDVILIDPGIDYQKLFKDINLPCMKEKRINNSLNAPIRTTAFEAMPRKQFEEDDN